MPQSTEQSVTGGRETFGEPKKLAHIEAERDGDRVTATVERLGFELMRVNGQITGPGEFPGGLGRTTKSAEFDSLLHDVTTRVFDVYDDSTVVYPGHGDDTTLGAERPHLEEWRERRW